MPDRKRQAAPQTTRRGLPSIVRLDAESEAILNRYCKQEGVSKMEAARRGIKRLKSDLKEE
ncbi:MAG: hypothetical protein ACLSAF_15505 [Intestinimonas sp.]